VILLGALATQVAYSQVSFRITGEATSIFPQDFFQVGETVSGCIAYDITIPDATADPYVGNYFESITGASFSFSNGFEVNFNTPTETCTANPLGGSCANRVWVWNVPRNEQVSFEAAVTGPEIDTLFGPASPTEFRVSGSVFASVLEGDAIPIRIITPEEYVNGPFGSLIFNEGANSIRFNLDSISAGECSIVPPSPPVASFEFTPEDPIPGENVTFNASESSDPDGEIVSYEWDFNEDGLPDAFGVEAQHAFTQDTAVTLTVEDNDGKRTSQTQIVILASHYGLFIGAYEQTGKSDSIDFTQNAMTMAAAFDARPNTEAYVLTGDLSKGANGELIDPITVNEVNRELQKIRSKMLPGDSLTLYINNHGGSFTFDSNGTPFTNRSGAGDEFIKIGEVVLGKILEDNTLAELLTQFDGHRVTVFLDTCHGGGFWGGTDAQEVKPPGRGINDLNQLTDIALYSGAAEDKEEYALAGRSFSFWGEALLEAIRAPISWSPDGLADYLEERTLELAEGTLQEAPVWYELAQGDEVTPDLSLIQTFHDKSADYSSNAILLQEPNPDSLIVDLVALTKGVGPGKSLQDKALDIEYYVDIGDLDSACGMLRGTLNEVLAQSGKQMSTQEAEGIEAVVRLTFATIGCGSPDLR